MIYLVIEEALQDEIKKQKNTKISHILVGVRYQTRKEIRKRLKLPLHMIWYGRRDHLVGYMTPLAGMPSSLVE